MSAENAWRIAREEAAQLCVGYVGGSSIPHYDERAKVADDMCEALAFALRSLPMPPAFRAEVEAEARAFAQREHPYADLHVEALAEIKATIDGKSDQPVAAIIEGVLEEIKARSDRLSRLEAKGKSHD